jgi:hypothetical protein
LGIINALSVKPETFFLNAVSVNLVGLDWSGVVLFSPLS